MPGGADLNILLVNPSDATYRHDGTSFKRSVNYYALTLPTLAALVPPELNADVRIVDEGVERLAGLEQADVVGITAVTCSAHRAYEIADRARALGKRVVLGGPHVTLVPDEAQRHADAVVLGFAEKTWPRLLRDIAAGSLARRYEADGGVEMGEVPIARRDLLKLNRYLPIPSIQASRGCPNECTFCAIPVVWGRRFHHRPIPRVLEEIAALGSKRLLFLDPAIAEDPPYAKALMEALVPLRVKWGGLSTIKIASDPELLDLAQRSGCVGLLIGFETVSQDGLRSIRKRFSTAREYEESIRGLHERGIRVLGTFVFGLDGDGDDVFERTAELVDRAQIDLVRYSAFTPFPGTPVFRELESEGRILTRDWSLYNTERVVFRPKNMSPERLAEGLCRAWSKTYSMASIVRRTRLSRHWLLALALNLGFRFYGSRVVGDAAKVLPPPVVGALPAWTQRV